MKPLAQSASVTAEDDNVLLAFVEFVSYILLETSHDKYCIFIAYWYLLVLICTAPDTKGRVLLLRTVVAARIQITSTTGYHNKGNASGVLGEKQVIYLSSWILFPS